MAGGNATWPLWRFHVDFARPGQLDVHEGRRPDARRLHGALSRDSPGCVPQLGTTTLLDGIGDRVMFRSAYRRFGDGHEALVGNMTVSSGGVAGIRWFEIDDATSGTPAFVQQSTYQPDTTWRWMGSAAMDRDGDLALGFSASSAVLNPQIRYAGRLATDPSGTLAQGEETLFAGTGSQIVVRRWGDYSDLTVDPGRRLHVLVHAGVLLGSTARASVRLLRLAHADRQLLVPLVRQEAGALDRQARRRRTASPPARRSASRSR